MVKRYINKYEILCICNMGNFLAGAYLLSISSDHFIFITSMFVTIQNTFIEPLMTQICSELRNSDARVLRHCKV